MGIKYDVPIEVTKKQYDKLIKTFAGIIAHRKDKDGKYWIKLWNMKYKNELKHALG